MGDPNIFGDILLVEDNPGDVRLTEETLKDSDLDPDLHVVSDGPDALEFLRQQGEYSDSPRPDLILLDLHLSRMDGEEVLREMNEEMRDIPVVAISGSQKGADLKLGGLGERVDAFLVKPVDPDDLERVADST